MKSIVLAAALSLVVTSAHATCKSDAADKKLAGAALKSFMTKCEKDAKSKCEADFSAKKLAGAARTESHEEMRHRRSGKLTAVRQPPARALGRTTLARPTAHVPTRSTLNCATMCSAANGRVVPPAEVGCLFPNALPADASGHHLGNPDQGLPNESH